VELAPLNTEYLEFRALQLEYDGADSTALLKRAAELNPMSSTPRIRLGLAAEMRGDFPAAEKWLLEAARIDRQEEPGWTLANFYFRRENTEEFWKWMRAALEISYGDRRPAFDLCWRGSNDAAEILRRAIPDRHEVLAGYLSYLLETHRVEAAAPVAMKLAAARDSEDREALLAACDALIGAHAGETSWNLWRATSLGEVSFESPRVGRGFDWQRVEGPGVTHIEIDQPRRAHRVKFNGSQPESCELLRRVFKLEAGRSYTLRWQSQAEFQGMEWRIGERRGALAEGQIAFKAESDLATLTLWYQRPSGQVRAEGSAEVWGVEVR
jgi:tetratricopeptide (TPR) repeat protein